MERDAHDDRCNPHRTARRADRVRPDPCAGGAHLRADAGRHGADVIKIERPGAGDDTRGFAPPFVPETKESAYFVGVNRNKRSVTLDIGTAEGQAIAKALIAKSDILVENFKVGALAKYGLGYDQLHAAYPGLIYCSITGFGQTGPYAPRPGYDGLVQAMGGRDEPDRASRTGLPMKVGIPVADVFAGLYGVHRHPGGAAASGEDGAGAADRHRHAGHACRVAREPGDELPGDRAEARRGWATTIRTSCPYQVFATADGHIVLSASPTTRRSSGSAETLRAWRICWRMRGLRPTRPGWATARL